MGEALHKVDVRLSKVFNIGPVRVTGLAEVFNLPQPRELRKLQRDHRLEHLRLSAAGDLHRLRSAGGAVRFPAGVLGSAAVPAEPAVSAARAPPGFPAGSAGESSRRGPSGGRAASGGIAGRARTSGRFPSRWRQDFAEIPVPPTLGAEPIRIHHPEGAFVSDAREPDRRGGDRCARGPLPGTRTRLGQRVRTARDQRGAPRRRGGGARTGTRPPRGSGGPGERPRQRSRGQGPVRRIGFLRPRPRRGSAGARRVRRLDRLHDREPLRHPARSGTGSRCGGSWSGARSAT